MAEPYIDTYYRDTLSSDKRRVPLAREEQADVCVIGGGLAGLNVALGLAERGRNVVLLEANRIGWGASGRNGGFVMGVFSQGYRALAEKLGLDHARELRRMAVAGRERIKSRIARYEIDCGPVTDGIIVPSCYDNPSALQDHVAFMDKEMGAPLIYWPRDKLRQSCRTSFYYDGYYSPDDFQIHPLNYAHGLAGAIEALGGRIYEDSRVTAIGGDAGCFKIRSARGTVQAGQVVLCCGPYAGGLDSQLKYASFPIHTYIMVTRPIPREKLDDSVATLHPVVDDRFAQDYYRRLPGERLLWGGRVSLRGAPDKLAEIMLNDLLKVYPQLGKAVHADYAWSGEMCYTPAKMPQLGQVRPGYWYCTAFGGAGLAATSACGDVLAAAIAEGDEQYKLLEPFSRLNFAGGPLSPLIAQSVYYLWRGRDVAARFGIRI